MLNVICGDPGIVWAHIADRGQLIFALSFLSLSLTADYLQLFSLVFCFDRPSPGTLHGALWHVLSFPDMIICVCKLSGLSEQISLTDSSLGGWMLLLLPGRKVGGHFVSWCPTGLPGGWKGRRKHAPNVRLFLSKTCLFWSRSSVSI